MVASNYKPNSEIALLNQRPLETPITISPDLYNILDIAKDMQDIGEFGKHTSRMGLCKTYQYIRKAWQSDASQAEKRHGKGN